MIRIILASHGNFAEGLLNGLEVIAGKQDNISTFSLKPGDNIESFIQSIGNLLKISKDNCESVLILTDLFGGSPTNAAIVNSEKFSFYCLTGMNLPMLIEAVNGRLKKNLDFREFVENVEEAGKNGINRVNKNKWR